MLFWKSEWLCCSQCNFCSVYEDIPRLQSCKMLSVQSSKGNCYTVKMPTFESTKYFPESPVSFLHCIFETAPYQNLSLAARLSSGEVVFHSHAVGSQDWSWEALYWWNIGLKGKWLVIQNGARVNRNMINSRTGNPAPGTEQLHVRGLAGCTMDGRLLGRQGPRWSRWLNAFATEKANHITGSTQKHRASRLTEVSIPAPLFNFFFKTTSGVVQSLSSPDSEEDGEEVEHVMCETEWERHSFSPQSKRLKVKGTQLLTWAT